MTESIRSIHPVKAIDQLLPNLAFGDAISNNAIAIRDHIRSLGFSSKIYVRFLDSKMAHQASIASLESINKSDAIIYHHSIGSEITGLAANFKGPKLLIYHNITPHHFFERYFPELVEILKKGREEELPKLAACFSHSCGDSAFNAQELAAVGFSNPQVLPIWVTPERFKATPTPGLMKVLQDGRKNILFVGRMVPNKKQDDLLTAFKRYLVLNPQARLIMVGKMEVDNKYCDYIRKLIIQLGLVENVIIPDLVSEEDLCAFYRCAHLFWSMSEHEGFMVPLLEAMWHDVPILAFASSAIPETLGQSGLLFTSKADFNKVAAIANQITSDFNLRQNIIAAQRKRRLDFLPQKIIPVLDGLLQNLMGEDQERMIAT